MEIKFSEKEKQEHIKKLLKAVLSSLEVDRKTYWGCISQDVKRPFGNSGIGRTAWKDIR